MITYRFYKNGTEWFIDLPTYLAEGGSIGDLQMVDGADKMLDLAAGAANDVILQLSETPFDGADRLDLVEKCDPYIGGGNYFIKDYEGREVNQELWLCQVTEFVFGGLPAQIFVKKEN